MTKKPVLHIVRGARNPYALAEHKLGKKVEWKGLSSREQRTILEMAFRMPYSRIVSSDNESPVHKIPQRKTGRELR